MDVKKETLIEKVASNLTTSLSVTAVASIAAGPLGAILATLVNTLANDRYKKRINETLQDIALLFDQLNEKVNNITDAQYKLINETLVTIHQTVEKEKLLYLKNTINNTIILDQVTHHEASIVSRVIRDISAKEAQFLVESKYKNNEYKGVCLDLQEPPKQSTSTRNGNKITANLVITFRESIYVKHDVLHISGDSEQIELINGLISLGLLIPSKITADGQYYTFSPIVTTLRNLLGMQEKL